MSFLTEAKDGFVFAQKIAASAVGQAQVIADGATKAFDFTVKNVDTGMDKIKTWFDTKRTLKVELSGKPCLDISFNPVTRKFAFHPKDGRFKIDGRKISFGRRNYHKTTVDIEL
jgi:hypothetical protein